MLEHELGVSVRARRGADVFDPLLALATPIGAQLVQRLGAVMDLWVVRSFWQVLDASEFYRRDALAFWPESMRATLPARTGPSVAAGVGIWEGVRARTDLANCGLHWVGDSLTESRFADDTPVDLIARYE